MAFGGDSKQQQDTQTETNETTNVVEVGTQGGDSFVSGPGAQQTVNVTDAALVSRGLDTVDRTLAGAADIFRSQVQATGDAGKRASEAFTQSAAAITGGAVKTRTQELLPIIATAGAALVVLLLLRK